MKMSPPKHLIEIICPTPPKVWREEEATGWGEGAGAMFIEGEPISITLAVDGKPQIKIHIGKDGSIQVLNYHGNLRAVVGDRIELEPSRNWKK